MAITKCINSESKQYKPVLTDKLVLDAVPTVNSLNSVTSDAVARAIAGASGEVPQVTESDNGKVLKAVYDAGGPAVEWGDATVDQTYDSTSTNAQSGTAVAQALASSSYTAGDGIDITANEVSVKAGDGLSFESAVSSTNLSAPAAQTGGSTFGHSLLGQLTADVVAALKTGTVTVKPLFAFKVQIDNGGVHFAICQKNGGYNTPYRGGDWLVASDAVSSATSGTYTMTVGDSYTVDFSTLDAKSTTTWSTIEANPTGYYLQLISYDTSMPLSAVADYASVNIGASVPTEDVVTVEVGDPSASKTIVVSNPLPASAVGDAGKVLTVDNSGAAAWAAPSAGGGITWSRNTQPSVDASGISATLSGLSVTNSSCVVNVSLKIEANDTFGKSMPRTLAFRILENSTDGKYYWGTLDAEPFPPDYSTASLYRACATVTLPYGSPELSHIDITDPGGTSLVVTGATYEVSVGVAK